MENLRIEIEVAPLTVHAWQGSLKIFRGGTFCILRTIPANSKALALLKSLMLAQDYCLSSEEKESVANLRLKPGLFPVEQRASAIERLLATKDYQACIDLIVQWKAEDKSE